MFNKIYRLTGNLYSIRSKLRMIFRIQLFIVEFKLKKSNMGPYSIKKLI